MRTSSIRHRANSRLAILFEDYLEICDGNMLASMLLAILVYWTDIKINKKDANLWVWKSHEDFQEDLMFDKPGMKPPHRTTISSALALLRSKDFIEWRKNPKIALDRTRQYLVHLEVVQAKIDVLPVIESRKTDIPLSENRLSIGQANEADSDDFTNVGKPTMQSRNTDNALSEKQQCIVGKPTSNTNDYITEITESVITEEEGEAPASLINFTEEKKKRTDPSVPVVQVTIDTSSHSYRHNTIGNIEDEDEDDTPTEKVPVVKPSRHIALRVQPVARERSQAPARLTVSPPGEHVPGMGNMDTRPAWVKPAPASRAITQERMPEPKGMTDKQRAQAEKTGLERREKEYWAIIEEERKTKYTKKQRELYENSEGMKCLIADAIPDEKLRTGLRALDAFQRKSFTVLKFYGWLPNLTAEDSPSLHQANGKPKSNSSKKSTDVNDYSITALLKRQAAQG